MVFSQIQKRLWQWASLLTLLFAGQLQANVLVSVDQNPAQTNQPIVLTVEVDQDLPADAFDASQLGEQFTLGRTSVRRNTQIINFDTRRTTVWQTVLVATQPGDYPIGPLTVGPFESQPFTLTVQAGANPNQSAPVEVFNSVSQSRAYLGQVLNYKVKLLIGAELQRGALTAPQLEGMSLQQIGEDKDTTEIIEGKRYRVIERNYALTLEEPGEYELPPAVFDGDIVVNSRSRDSLFAFNQSMPTRAEGEPLTLTVLDKPIDFNGPWLVSDMVVLQAVGDALPDSVEVGQPLNLNWQITAVNSDVNAIPEPQMELPGWVKRYPEKPQRNSAIRNEQLISQLTINQALIPTQAGELVIPDVELLWFNPHTKRAEVARLEGKTITVVAADGLTLPVEATVQPQPSSAEPSNLLPWQLASAALALGWLGHWLWWRREKSTESKAPARTAPKNDDLQRFHDACQKGQLGDALKLLTGAAAQVTGERQSLTQLRQHSPQLAKALDIAQAHTYSPNKSDSALDLMPLYQLVANLPKKAHSSATLAPLYPLSNKE
ncbi:BatD family protein [Paraferrimonas sedimenticola]|uniref:Protein BatD n=1 Tax=Paraferrimonas sedimenticola TaxID=375674 RepID=A0AA37RWX7_9GAMM|nr:BatD family protein [Paraferrimonas sedimenticola]GLP96601.1 hypothetical protein GCM10007895_19070 [Paraferrimonas sedimenticola]